jgi:hypothetical protein
MLILFVKTSIFVDITRTDQRKIPSTIPVLPWISEIHGKNGAMGFFSDHEHISCTFIIDKTIIVEEGLSKNLDPKAAFTQNHDYIHLVTDVFVIVIFSS